MKKILLLIAVSLITLNLFSCGLGHDDDIEYAALGASDATGIGASPITHGYVYLIEEGIQDAGRSIALNNYGVPDIEIGGIVDVELEFLDAGPTPNLVTLFTGVNDIIAGSGITKFETDLDKILSHLAEIDGAQVFIANIPDLTKLPRFRDGSDDDVTTARIAAFNAIIERQSARYGAHLVNLAADAPDDTLVSDDGLHPNNEGHKRIAQRFLQEILPLLPAKEED